MAMKMQAQKEEIKALKIQSEKQIHAITQNYEQRLDKLREAIGKCHDVNCGSHVDEVLCWVNFAWEFVWTVSFLKKLKILK